MKDYPNKNQVYTFEQILTKLALRDQPCLMMTISGRESPIQLSHFNPSKLLSDEIWKNSEWAYLFETSEWVPVFQFNGDLDQINKMVKYEPDINVLSSSPALYVTPISFPRKQFNFDYENV